jgi:adenylate kinase family enzyme
VRRVVVVGNSGSGKTTLAAELARILQVPHVELDAIYHQPGWTELPTGEYRARVAAALPADAAWVCDGNDSAVRELTWSRADTLVWLDLPRRVVLPRIVARSLGRAARRTDLWNGNRESWRMLLSLHDPEKSVIAWSVTQHNAYRERYRRLPADPQWAHLRFVRLGSPAAVRRWLDRVPAS